MRIWSFWLGWGVLLASCGVAPLTVPPEAALERFVGRPISAVVDSWGAPNEVTTVAGTEHYLWVATHYGSDYLPANFDPSAAPSRAGRLQNLPCKAVFTVATDGTVLVAEWLGTECREP